MNKIKRSYGICIENCEIQNRNTNKREQLLQGALIRILEAEYDNGSGDAGGDSVIIKLYNATDNTFKTDMFECAKKHTGYISGGLWLFMIGTRENKSRFEIYNERESVLALTLGREIVIKTYDNDSNANIKGVVESIGPINDAGIGNFVGLKLLKFHPEKRQTMVNLHKRHYNGNLSLHMFRIEELLDALKPSKPNSQLDEKNKTTNPMENKKPIEVNLATCNISENVSIERNMENTNPFLPIVADELPNISLTSQNIPCRSELMAVIRGFQARDETNTISDDVKPQIFTSNAIVTEILGKTENNFEHVKLVDQPKETGAVPKRNISTSITKRKDFRGAKNDINGHKFQTNTSAITFQPISPNDSKQPASKALQTSLLESPTLLKPSDRPEINPISKTNKNQSVCNKSEGNEKSAIAKANGQVPITKKISRNKSEGNEKSAISKTDSLTRISKKKIRSYSGKKNEKMPNWKQSVQCHNCNGPFGRDTLLLKCKHCICVGCFGVNISSLIGTNRVRCPFTTPEEFCDYHLKNFELDQLRQKIANFVLLPTEDNSASPAKREYSDSEEEIFECKTDGCQGKWFISKYGAANLYGCPLCKLTNCVHCHVIHDNMTCTDYKNANAQQNCGENIQNVTVAFEPAGVVSLEPNATMATNKNIVGDSSGHSTETVYKCRNENCAGQFVDLKLDDNVMYKCPTCQLFNCFSCNAIHQNQTCNEYQEAKRPKTPIKPLLNNNFRHSGAGSNNFNARQLPSNGRGRPMNFPPKRLWSCNICTFENFNSGNKCHMCRKINS